MRQIFLYDTTLRDGTQGEDVAFSVEDKVRIAQRLDGFGFHYIEGGWPGSNPRDLEFFRRVKDLPLRHAKIAAFGSTRRPQNTVENDPNLQALLEARTPVVTIFGKTWLLHVNHALQISESENLALIGDSVRFLKAQGKEVIYDAEHFFDGYKDDAGYALRTLLTAQDAGADIIVLCDTNGGTMNAEVTAIVAGVKPHIRVPLGIHTHNDAELAVANTLAAIAQGAVHVQGTINGYGERCGNANLCSIIPNLQLKLGYTCVAEEQLADLASLSHFVSELANLAPRKHLAYVGESAFAHKGGIHVSAVMKEPQTYEHIPPEAVGNRRRVLVSDLSGRSNVVYKARELGVDLESKPGVVQQIVDDIKANEYEGYRYEDADGSLKLLMKQRMDESPEFFELEGFKVITHRATKGHPSVSEAWVKVRVDEKVEHTVAEGIGPVNALDNALRKALDRFYPELRNMELTDYKVRVLDGQEGTRAKVRVLLTTKDGDETWSTVGVSPNIIEASWKALVDSVYYYLMRTESNVGVRP
ncbi:MAG TPA: citramalate synthase [Bacteroidota bacterium]|nr:citramalate synthase [Bacteroidota bacterium]